MIWGTSYTYLTTDRWAEMWDLRQMQCKNTNPNPAPGPPPVPYCVILALQKTFLKKKKNLAVSEPSHKANNCCSHGWLKVEVR